MINKCQAMAQNGTMRGRKEGGLMNAIQLVYAVITCVFGGAEGLVGLQVRGLRRATLGSFWGCCALARQGRRAGEGEELGLEAVEPTKKQTTIRRDARPCNGLAAKLQSLVSQVCPVIPRSEGCLLCRRNP